MGLLNKDQCPPSSFLVLNVQIACKTLMDV